MPRLAPLGFHETEIIDVFRDPMTVPTDISMVMTFLNNAESRMRRIVNIDGEDVIVIWRGHHSPSDEALALKAKSAMLSGDIGG